MSEGFWSEKNQVVTAGNPSAIFNTIGDKVRGYLVKKSFRLNDMKEDDGLGDVYQRVYTIRVKEGEVEKAKTKDGVVDVKAGGLIDVYGKMLSKYPMEGKRVQIILGADDVAYGTMLGFLFTGELPPKKKGFKPTKVVKAYADPDDVSQESVKEAGWGGMKAPVPSTPDAPAAVTPSEDAPFV